MQAKTIFKQGLLIVLGFVFLTSIAAVPGLLALEKITSLEGFEVLVTEVAGQEIPPHASLESFYQESPMVEAHEAIVSSFWPTVAVAAISLLLIIILKHDDSLGLLGFAVKPFIFSGIMLLLFPLLLQGTISQFIAGMMPGGVPEGVVERVLASVTFVEMFDTFKFYGFLFIGVAIVLKLIQFLLKKQFPQLEQKKVKKPAKKA